MYYSQYGQDKWLEENVFQGKRDGLFIDIGASDGVTLSNTFFFEKERNWLGVCFEPHPEAFKKLAQSRINLCYPWAVWSEDVIKKFTVIDGYSEMLSGLTDAYPPAHQWRIKQEIQQFNQQTREIDVQCKSISKILEAMTKGYGKDVDLISIDTEGSELEILKSVDYDVYRIHAIACENNYEDYELRGFMNKKGFGLRARLGVDDLFINKNWKYEKSSQLVEETLV
jgi:FkbM family methyltransferase